LGRILLCAVCASWLLTAVPTLADISVLDSAVNPANGHTYILLDGSAWTDAESEAIALGGHLVTLNDQAEEDWLWGKWGPNRSLLIGLTDAAQEGTFVWTSGELFNYSHWAPGEPNNGVGYGTGPENYVYITRAGTSNPGFWNDFNGQPLAGQSPMFGVVELVPEPAAGGLLLLGVGAMALRRLNANCSRN
jgi:hypothetical protein